jgi:CheY-like chemotaxis protein
MLCQFELVIFEDSAGFLEKIKALPRKPDVFLLDIHVRPYDGYEMLAMLRADAEYANSAVIALTASVTNEEVIKLRERGFSGAVGKPFSIATFPGLIRRIAAGESVWHIA